MRPERARDRYPIDCTLVPKPRWEHKAEKAQLGRKCAQMGSKKREKTKSVKMDVHVVGVHDI